MINIMQYYDEIGVRYIYTKASIKDYGKAIFGNTSVVENTRDITVTANYKSLIDDEDTNGDYYFVILDYIKLKENRVISQVNEILVCSNLNRRFVVNILNWEKFLNKNMIIESADIEDLELIENILSSRESESMKKSNNELSEKKRFLDKDAVISELLGSEFKKTIKENRYSLKNNLGCVLIDGIFEMYTIPFELNDDLAKALCQMYIDKIIEDTSIKKIRNLVYLMDVVSEPIASDEFLIVLLDILWRDRLLHLDRLGNNIKESLQNLVINQIENEKCINNNICAFASIFINAIPNVTLLDNFYYYILHDEETVKYVTATKYIDTNAYDSIFEALDDNSSVLCNATKGIIGAYANKLYLEPKGIKSLYKEYMIPRKTYVYKKMRPLGMSCLGIVVVNLCEDILLIGKDSTLWLGKFDNKCTYNVLADKVYIELESTENGDITTPYYIDLLSCKRIDCIDKLTCDESIDVWGIPVASDKTDYVDEIRIGTFKLTEEKLIYSIYSPIEGKILESTLISPPLYSFEGRCIYNLSVGRGIISYCREIDDSELAIIADIYGLSSYEVTIQNNEIDDSVAEDKYIHDVYLYDYFDEE